MSIWPGALIDQPTLDADIAGNFSSSFSKAELNIDAL